MEKLSLKNIRPDGMGVYEDAGGKYPARVVMPPDLKSEAPFRIIPVAPDSFNNNGDRRFTIFR